MTLLGVSVSEPFIALIQMQMAFGSFEVGVLQRTPVPVLVGDSAEAVADLTQCSWSLKRRIDTATLTSHAFSAPALAPSRSSKKSSRS
jgi:hypothetical protein